MPEFLCQDNLNAFKHEKQKSTMKRGSFLCHDTITRTFYATILDKFYEQFKMI